MKVKEAIKFLEWLSENTPYMIKYQNGEDFKGIAEILLRGEKIITNLEDEIEKLHEEKRSVETENEELKEKIKDIKDDLFDIWKGRL